MVQRLHDVLVVPGPVPPPDVGELLGVAVAPPGVEVEHGVAGGRVELVLEHEGVAVLAFRPAVDVQYGGIFFPFFEATGLHHPPVDRCPVARLELEGLRLDERHIRKQVVVEAREPSYLSAITCPEFDGLGLLHPGEGRRPSSDGVLLQ